jgi:predicted enzyme related to lactoylglutathione lyase
VHRKKEIAMKPGPGAFIWYELMTTDVDAAQNFYESVFGWAVKDSGMSDMDYRIVHAGERPIGGMMALRDEQLEAGARPFWGGYIGVADVDAATEKAESLGASTHVPPMDIPEVGRFSVISDPQGGMITLFTGAGTPPEGTAQGNGIFAWHELATTDWPKAFDFYSAMFGWTKGEGIDMGPLGTYQLFGLGGEVVGGLFNKPPELPVVAWLYYVEVDALGAAIKRVEAGGGQILNGPMQVPGGSWIAQCMDPQGGAFAMVSPQP